MTKILFVCHGNICRSPMAELMISSMAERAGIAAELYAESAATSFEEIGNGVYPPARHKLAEHGIACGSRKARRIVPEDYERFDLLIGMDDRNIRNMLRVFGGDPHNKLHTLLEYAGRAGENVADPWYTDDFDETWDDLYEGCMGLLYELFPLVTLDFSACLHCSELYDIMSDAMLWQENYGHNLDAVYDIMTGLPHIGQRLTVRLPAEDAPCRKYAEKLCEVLSDAGKRVSIEN